MTTIIRRGSLFLSTVALGLVVVDFARELMHAIGWLHAEEGRCVSQLFGSGISGWEFAALYSAVGAVMGVIGDAPLLVACALVCLAFKVRGPARVFCTSLFCCGWAIALQEFGSWPITMRLVWLPIHGYFITTSLVLVAAACGRIGFPLSRVSLASALSASGGVLFVLLSVDGYVVRDALASAAALIATAIAIRRAPPRFSKIIAYVEPRVFRAGLAGIAVLIVAGLAAMRDTMPETSPSQVASAKRPNVVLVVVDCLRADAVSCYGGSEGLTPNIDALARDGVMFRHAWSASSWTRPSVTSLLTGVFPATHGVWSDLDTLSAGIGYLPEELHKEGYATGGFISSPMLLRLAGFHRGFDRYEDGYGQTRLEKAISMHYVGSRGWNLLGGLAFMARRALGWHGPFWVLRTSDALTNEATEWLGKEPRQPFFLYMHYFDLHTPYNRESGFPEISGHVRPQFNITGSRSLYFKSLARIDKSLGDLIGQVERHSDGRPTLFILTADHGEQVDADRIVGHGIGVSEGELRVPLIFRWTGRLPMGQSREDLSNHVDLPNTVLSLLDLPPLHETQGMALFPGPSGRIYNFSQYYGGEPPRVFCRWLAVADGTWKATLFEKGGSEIKTLYHILEDPSERHNLILNEPERFRRLEAVARTHENECLRVLRVGTSRGFHGSVLRDLAAFGYME